MFRTGSNYYPKVFLEQYKCVVKELKMPENITDKIEISSYSHREDFDEENSDEGNSNEENSEEEI